MAGTRALRVPSIKVALNHGSAAALDQQKLKSAGSQPCVRQQFKSKQCGRRPELGLKVRGGSKIVSAHQLRCTFYQILYCV